MNQAQQKLGEQFVAAKDFLNKWKNLGIKNYQFTFLIGQYFWPNLFSVVQAKIIVRNKQLTHANIFNNREEELAESIKSDLVVGLNQPLVFLIEKYFLNKNYSNVYFNINKNYFFPNFISYPNDSIFLSSGIEIINFEVID